MGSLGLTASPDGKEIDLSRSVAEKTGSLRAAAESGKQFLVIDSRDARESVAWILASFASPVAAAPINPDLPKNEADSLLTSLPAQSWVRSSELPVVAPVKSSSPAQKDPAGIWALIFSSGSTGTPKGIAISGHALQSAALAHHKHLPQPAKPWLLQLPVFHIGGFSIISRAYFLGSRVAIPDRKPEIAELAGWLASGEVGGISLVPTVLYRLVQQGVSPHEALECVLLGGAPCPDDLYDQGSKLGFPLRRTYGMTEACSQIATETDHGSGMKPLPGMDVALSESGEILIDGTCLASGYFVDGSIVPLPRTGRYFATGDLGALCGGELTVIGRKSDMILSGGLNIHPLEIENRLVGRKDLVEFAAFSIPDEEWGEKLCLAVVPRNGDTFAESDILDFLRNVLDRRKVPKAVFRMEALPRTPSGKVKRWELRSFFQKNVPLA